MVFLNRAHTFILTLFCSAAFYCSAVFARAAELQYQDETLCQHGIEYDCGYGGYGMGQLYYPMFQEPQVHYPPPAPHLPHPAMAEQQQQQTQPDEMQEPLAKQERQKREELIQLQSSKLPLYKLPDCGPTQEGYTVNFENISVIQLIKFISQISGTNFIFNNEDLNFNITIVSEDPTSVTDLSSALLQILKMHNLSVVEQGNNVLIYRSPQSLSKVSTIITEDNVNASCDNVIITRVFKLYNVLPDHVAQIVSKLVSPEAIVEPSVETRHLIVTDITSNVNKIAELLSALDTPSLAIDVATYSVQGANAIVLAEYAREILAPLAGEGSITITPEPASQKIFIVGSPFIIDKALQILNSLDVPEITSLQPPLPPSIHLENNLFYLYKLKYQSGQEIVDALREIGVNLQYTGVANPEFVNSIYSIQWIPVNNSIVITGTEDAIHKIISLVDELDQLPKQVFIEVLILDTTLANSLDFGVQWIALGDEQNKLAFASGLLGTPGQVAPLEGTATTTPGARFVASGGPTAPTNPPPLIPNPGRDVALPNPGEFCSISDISVLRPCLLESFGLGIIGNIIRHNGRSFLTLGALISALDAEANTKLVLNPRVMVEDTQPANFFVGQNIPYQTTSTVVQQTGSVTQNIQYEDIGVQLQVTPTIAPDNMVTLQINQTVAEVIPGGGLTPTTTKTLATTRVHVPDGTFLVMSGQIRDECTCIRSGIPCLGTLPLIGPAFSRNVETREKRNLIFFIRPKVVTNIEQGIILTNDEGYEYNWNSNPCSLIEAGCSKAPECEMYPNPCWPPRICPPKKGPNGQANGMQQADGSHPNNPYPYETDLDLKPHSDNSLLGMPPHPYQNSPGQSYPGHDTQGENNSPYGTHPNDPYGMQPNDPNHPYGASPYGMHPNDPNNPYGAPYSMHPNDPNNPYGAPYSMHPNDPNSSYGGYSNTSYPGYEMQPGENYLPYGGEPTNQYAPYDMHPNGNYPSYSPPSGDNSYSPYQAQPGVNYAPYEMAPGGNYPAYEGQQHENYYHPQGNMMPYQQCP